MRHELCSWLPPLLAVLVTGCTCSDRDIGRALESRSPPEGDASLPEDEQDAAPREDGGNINHCEQNPVVLPDPLLVVVDNCLSSGFDGTAVVVSQSVVESRFELASSSGCGFGIQRVDMPRMFEVGESFEVRFRYAQGLTGADWAIHILGNGVTVFFAFNGRYSGARFVDMEPPGELRFKELCVEEDPSCYESITRLALEMSNGVDRVTVGPQESALLRMRSQDSMRVLNYGAVRYAGPGTRCVGLGSPGEFIALQLVRSDVDLGVREVAEP
jgi:hypothetical protein